jgi:ribose transport system permease protein
MTAQILAGSDIGRWAHRNQGMLVALATFAAAFAVLASSLSQGIGYYDAASTVAATATLAIAAIGATIVVISRGLDLSVGAVISLSNCLIAANVGDTPQSMTAWAVAGVLAGVVTGAFNAVFIVVLRLPSIIVTLATMFIVQGLTLLVMEQPGGAVPAAFSSVFIDDMVPGLLPMPAVLIAVALLVWGVVRATRLGTYIYAVGSDEEAARARGVPVAATRAAVYVIAGAFYGLAGVFLTAQTASGDPTVGPPMLLPVFVAVVLGGTVFAGGRGGAVGTVLGAFTLMLLVNLLLVFNVPTFYSTVVEGGLLIAAVLASSGPRLRRVGLSLMLAFERSRIAGGSASVRRQATDHIAPRRDDTLPPAPLARWLRRNRADLKSALPAWAGLVAVLCLTAVLFSDRLGVGSYVNSLLMLSTFLAVLALGQGSVVISGGLDLSVPALITFSGVMLCEWTMPGSNLGNWSILAVCAAGLLIGAASGLGIGLVGIHPLIMTLAVNGILEGATLVITDGTPQGMPPAVVGWLMSGRLLGLAPVVWMLLVFVLLASLLLGRSVYARKLYAVGSSPTVAFFSGVSVGRVQVATYALSGLCSAIVGILLAGFSGQAFIDMGTPYLLPSIAVVVIGGVAMTGGRGIYLGMLGGALLLTALSTVLQGMLMPLAIRNIIFGFVVLAAVLGLRETSR